MPIICHDPKHAVFCRSLQQLPRSTKRFAFYPFTNEENYAAVLKSLHKLPILPTEGRAVALLVGESNILSLLPDLATKVTIILCNDINPRMNAHTHLLIKCLLETTDIEEFRHLYFSECELMGIERAEIEDHMQTAEQDLGGAYVLSSPERFQVCQDAARKLTFVWASIDLLCQQEVQLLVDTLHGYKANISFMNVSNIHHYCDEYLLAENLKILLQGKNAYIMFSCSLEGKDTLILRTKLVASFHYTASFCVLLWRKGS